MAAEEKSFAFARVGNKRIALVVCPMARSNNANTECLVCGSGMETIQACHLRCPNCGSEMTCGEKGIVW